MSRFTIEILPEAETEFREAFLWYFERSPIFADAFRTEVLAKIDELQEDADSWPIISMSRFLAKCRVAAGRV